MPSSQDLPRKSFGPRNIFRALRHKNYRLFSAGQCISLVGTWMQYVAVSWLVYRLTNSAFMLGLVGFVGQLPTFVIAPLAGVLGDRYDRRRMLIIIQSLAMAQAAVLAFLVMTHLIQIWHIIVLSTFLGIISSFDMTIRQAFTVEMIDDREDLGNAIALNSTMLNAARLIGPAMAGLLIVSIGEGICFLLNAISYTAVIASLLVMRIPKGRILAAPRRILLELKEGFSYAANFPPIKWLLLVLSLISLMGVSYQILLPVITREIFKGGANTMGFFMTMAGFGALGGAIFLAARKSVLGLPKIIAWTAGLFGLTLMAFAFSRTYWLSMGILLVSGFGMMVHMAACNTILQTIVEEDKRTRIMSFYTMAFLGMMPFGSLLAGSLAARIGAPYTLFLEGLCCVLGAVYFASKLPLIRAKIRPIYMKKGIIPEVVRGIQAATGLESLTKE
ncbi:MAG: MFS transporter [Candidatus Omnitrophota bacterium]